MWSSVEVAGWLLDFWEVGWSNWLLLTTCSSFFQFLGKDLVVMCWLISKLRDIQKLCKKKTPHSLYTPHLFNIIFYLRQIQIKQEDKELSLSESFGTIPAMKLLCITTFFWINNYISLLGSDFGHYKHLPLVHFIVLSSVGSKIISSTMSQFQCLETVVGIPALLLSHCIALCCIGPRLFGLYNRL